MLKEFLLKLPFLKLGFKILLLGKGLGTTGKRRRRQSKEKGGNAFRTFFRVPVLMLLWRGAVETDQRNRGAKGGRYH